MHVAEIEASNKEELMSAPMRLNEHSVLIQGIRTMSDEERAAMLEEVMERVQEGELALQSGHRQAMDSEAHRCALALATEALEADRRMPDQLRIWLAGALHDLLAAVDPARTPSTVPPSAKESSGTALNRALARLGRPGRGHPKDSTLIEQWRQMSNSRSSPSIKDQPDAMAVAAAVELARKTGQRGDIDRTKDHLAEGLGVSVDTIDAWIADIGFSESSLMQMTQGDGSSAVTADEALARLAAPVQEAIRLGAEKLAYLSEPRRSKPAARRKSDRTG